MLRNNRIHLVVGISALASFLISDGLGSEEGFRPAAEYPAASPDGTKLVYVSNQNGSRDLWISSANGANATVLTSWPGTDEKQPSWSPDGQHIVFSSTRGTTKHNIWIINPDGSNAQQLTSDDAEHEQPRYSPQGSSILYLSNKTGKQELWIMNADGSGQRSIALISTRVSDPTWSPDGQRIAYVGCRRGGACNLFRINADGFNGLQITSGDFQDWNPDWGAPGIIFASNRGGSQGLWLIQGDGSGLQQLTAPDGTADLYPRWIGNTSSFVFSRSGKNPGDAASDVWSTTSSGSTAQQITKLVVDTTPPVITPLVTGTLGNNAWYVSGVVITWQVSDPESGVASSTGCSQAILSTDTAGVTITCTATNGVGLTASVPITIKIDKTPPIISGMPSPGCSLWPPNHKLVQVATVTASDALSGLAPGSFAVTGSSSEPTDPNDPAIVIGSNGSGGGVIQLRADRLGAGTGRVYTLNAKAADLAGNTASVTATCTVPHDQGK